MVKYWTRSEIRFLEKNHKKLTPDKLADKIGRTENAVRIKMKRKGLNALKKERKGEKREEFVTKDQNMHNFRCFGCKYNKELKCYFFTPPKSIVFSFKENELKCPLEVE